MPIARLSVSLCEYNWITTNWRTVEAATLISFGNQISPFANISDSHLSKDTLTVLFFAKEDLYFPYSERLNCRGSVSATLNSDH